jgi:tetratricopeptide (TPR) repeat protein
MRASRVRSESHSFLGRAGFVVLVVGLAALCRPLLSQPAPSAGSWAAYLAGEIQDWQSQISGWRMSGHVCWWLTLGVGVLGVVISTLQPLKRKWVKAAGAVLGVLVSVLTLVRTETYPNGHRTYLQAADAAEQRLRRLKRWAQPVERVEEQQEADKQVREILRELDEIARQLSESPGPPSEAALSLLPVVRAQSLPAQQKPTWLGGRPADADRVYFVGVALDASLDAAGKASKANALAAARDDLAVPLSKVQGLDPGAMAAYLSSGASVLDTYYEREGTGYRYYTLIALSKRMLGTDARLYAVRQNAQVSASVIDSAKAVQATAPAYQLRREDAYAALAGDARTRTSAEAYRLFDSGRLARQQGNSAEAVRALEGAVKLAPEFYLAWYNLGLAAESGGDRVRAQAAYEKAVQLEPQQKVRDASLYNTYGWLLYRQNKLAEARAQFQKALQLDPKHPLATRNLQAVQAKLPG